MALSSGGVNQFFEIAYEHLLATFDHTITLRMTCTARDMTDMVFFKESAHFLVHIFLPFIRNEQEGTTEVGNNLSSERIDDALMCFVRTRVYHNKTGSRINNGANSDVNGGRFWHVD